MNKQLIDAAPSHLGSNDETSQQAVYNPPNYKNLASASNALDNAIDSFFQACREKCDGE